MCAFAVVFSSDNGGREDATFGGNNFPLRGMKFTDFEGGTRVAAWASGGVIPANLRGSTTQHLIHICDW
jgi:arylsulfatase B